MNNLSILSREELFILASEANSKNDEELLDMITDELTKRRLADTELNKG